MTANPAVAPATFSRWTLRNKKLRSAGHIYVPERPHSPVATVAFGSSALIEIFGINGRLRSHSVTFRCYHMYSIAKPVHS